MPAAGRATTTADRSSSFAGHLAAVCIVVSLTLGLARVEGRKCVCTSRACREMGADVCSTRFSCYTEFILTAGQAAGDSTTTRGCTESATPLLCETKSWTTRSRSVNNNAEPSASPWVRVPWPRLKCCDSHDFCNADDDDDDAGTGASTWAPDARTKATDPASSAAMGHGAPGDAGASTSGDAAPTTIQQRRNEDRQQHENSAELSGDRLLRSRVKALHIAALVLAVAAIISVLASCYVVTRFAHFLRARDLDFTADRLTLYTP